MHYQQPTSPRSLLQQGMACRGEGTSQSYTHVRECETTQESVLMMSPWPSSLPHIDTQCSLLQYKPLRGVHKMF